MFSYSTKETEVHEQEPGTRISEDQMVWTNIDSFLGSTRLPVGLFTRRLHTGTSDEEESYL